MVLLLYGAGGHAKAVIATIEVDGRYSLQRTVDDDPEWRLLIMSLWGQKRS
jgi:hypothetical protein